MVTARPDGPPATQSPTPPAAVADPLTALKTLLAEPAEPSPEATSSDPSTVPADDPSTPPADVDGGSVLGQLTGIGGDLAATVPVPLSSAGSRRRSQPSVSPGLEVTAAAEEGRPGPEATPSSGRAPRTPSATAPDGYLQESLSIAASFSSTLTGGAAGPLRSEPGEDLRMTAAIAAAAALSILAGIATQARRRRRA
jgi:hypothetical protein